LISFFYFLSSYFRFSHTNPVYFNFFLIEQNGIFFKKS
ncbi:hypothetical protein BAE44_0019720, partial [Dichanthelium oligosanthes]